MDQLLGLLSDHALNLGLSLLFLVIIFTLRYLVLRTVVTRIETYAVDPEQAGEVGHSEATASRYFNLDRNLSPQVYVKVIDFGVTVTGRQLEGGGSSPRRLGRISFLNSPRRHGSSRHTRPHVSSGPTGKAPDPATTVSSRPGPDDAPPTRPGGGLEPGPPGGNRRRRR